VQAKLTELAARTSPEYWAADGVHPTPAGHALIAERWRRAVRLS
jgi:phospholipase/lecithinase/hemolysin